MCSLYNISQDLTLPDQIFTSRQPSKVARQQSWLMRSGALLQSGAVSVFFSEILLDLSWWFWVMAPKAMVVSLLWFWLKWWQVFPKAASLGGATQVCLVVAGRL